jgi:hypothetical protein
MLSATLPLLFANASTHSCPLLSKEKTPPEVSPAIDPRFAARPGRAKCWRPPPPPAAILRGAPSA